MGWEGRSRRHRAKPLSDSKMNLGDDLKRLRREELEAPSAKLPPRPAQLPRIELGVRRPSL